MTKLTEIFESLKNTEQKEYFIVSNMVICNNELNNLPRRLPKYFDVKLFESNNFDKGLSFLFEQLTNKKLNIEKIIQEDKIKNISDYNNNPLAYFIEQKSFFDSVKNGEDSSILTVLNESITNINDNTEIFSFGNLVNETINKLLNINDFDELDLLDDSIIRIKSTLNQPINIYGFDIINSHHLTNMFIENNLSKENLISVIYEKSNRQLLFVFAGEIYVYDIKTNVFDKYNKVNNDNILTDLSDLNKNSFAKYIHNNVSGNLLYVYVNVLNIKPSFDNLYGDNFNNQKQIYKQAEIINNSNINLFVK